MGSDFVSQGPWIEPVHARNMKFIKSFRVMPRAGPAGSDCCVQLAQAHCVLRALRLREQTNSLAPHSFTVC
jgi:hypothetical protein